MKNSLIKRELDQAPLTQTFGWTLPRVFTLVSYCLFMYVCFLLNTFVLLLLFIVIVYCYFYLESGRAGFSLLINFDIKLWPG